MTTIVHYKGEIACDSRITARGAIQTDKAQKRFVSDGYQFFLAGSCSDWPKFIDAFITGANHGDLECGAFVVFPDKRVVRSATNADGSVWMNELIYDEPAALGSGSDHAITAIDCGKTVREAVKMAAKRDSATGGLIRVYKV